MSHDPPANLNQPRLQCGQRPVGHLFRQISTLQEDTQIVGQCVKLKADLGLRHSLAGQAGPVDIILAFLDVRSAVPR